MVWILNIINNNHSILISFSCQKIISMIPLITPLISNMNSPLLTKKNEIFPVNIENHFSRAPISLKYNWCNDLCQNIKVIPCLFYISHLTQLNSIIRNEILNEPPERCSLSDMRWQLDSNFLKFKFAKTKEFQVLDFSLLEQMEFIRWF